MNPVRALLAPALLLAAAAAPAQEAPPPAPAPVPATEAPRTVPDARPWDGFLPDPDQRLPDEDEGDAGSEWFGVRVLDAATGRPVAGARWVRTPEAVSPGNVRHDAVMAVAVTDADGIARMETRFHDFSGESHWLVLADGYAPAYEYADLPETEVLLQRGQPFRGVLLDPMGRPVAGGVVEYLGGCSHGTAALRAVTAADGSFTLPPHVPGGQYWIEGPGIASDLMAADDPDSLGSRPGLVVAGESGRRLEGRVVDPLGRPVANCVVRCYNEQRGPATATDADGRFVLEGAEEVSLVLFPESDWTGDESEWYVHDGRPGVPMNLIVTSLGIREEEADARVRVRALDPEGVAAADATFQVLSAATGRGPVDATSDEFSTAPDEPHLGEALAEIPAGRFRVVPEDPFSAWEFDPVEGEAVAGAETVVTLSVRERPRVRVKGWIPSTDDIEYFLVLPEGEESFDPGGEGGEAPHLPASAPAVVRVERVGAPPVFFPVGPERNGIREATISLPAPRRIVLPKGARDAGLHDGLREIACREGDAGTLETWAEGRVTVRWTDGMKVDRTLDLDLPPLEGGTLVLRPDEGRALPGETTVRLVEREGEGEDATEETEEAEESPGTMVVFRDEGRRTVRALAPPDGILEVRRGPCALDLAIRDGDDDPADALVSVDGEIYAAPEGSLVLSGLEPGPHAVRVALRDRVGGGRAFEVVLSEGPPARLALTLGE